MKKLALPLVSRDGFVVLGCRFARQKPGAVGEHQSRKRLTPSTSPRGSFRATSAVASFPANAPASATGVGDVRRRCAAWHAHPDVVTLISPPGGARSS